MIDATTLRLLLAVLTAYRLARMVTLERGPWLVFEGLRNRVGTDMDMQGRQTALGELVSCPLCMGVYVSLLVLLAVLWPTVPGDAMLLWFGLAGAQTYLQTTET